MWVRCWCPNGSFRHGFRWLATWLCQRRGDQWSGRAVGTRGFRVGTWICVHRRWPIRYQGNAHKHVMRIPPTQHTRTPATSAPRTCIVVPHHVNLRSSGIACAHMPCQQRRVRVRGATVEHTHGDQQRAPEAVGTVAGCMGEHLRVGSLSPQCGGGAQTSMALVRLARSCPRHSGHEARPEGSARNSHVRVAAGHGSGRGEVPWGHGNTATNGWAHHLPSHDVRAVCVAGQRRSQHVANWWCWHALCASGPVQTVHVGWCSG